jgi:hypothetical protein
MGGAIHSRDVIMGDMSPKALLWTGVGLCVAGAVTLVVVAVVDVGKADQTASVIGGIVGLAGLALALYAQFGTAPAAAAQGVAAAGERSIAAGGNIGSASTGDAATPAPAPSPAPPALPAPGTLRPGGVQASGDRSIAAGGDIGSASTGDA